MSEDNRPIPAEDGKQLAVGLTNMSSLPRLTVAMALAGKSDAASLGELLNAIGGTVCSHSVETEEGLILATRLAGEQSELLMELPDKTTIDVDGWLISDFSFVDGDEVKIALAVTLRTTNGQTYRSTSPTVRRSMGLILAFFVSRPWEAVRMQVQKRKTTKPTPQLSLGYLGTLKSLTVEVGSDAKKPKK